MQNHKKAPRSEVGILFESAYHLDHPSSTCCDSDEYVALCLSLQHSRCIQLGSTCSSKGRGDKYENLGILVLSLILRIGNELQHYPELLHLPCYAHYLQLHEDNASRSPGNLPS
ncbi:hypothetical protein C0J52_09608 [Blattella germanica]|nr:hypothetical protein C0J52_09608 [Blattella germanica]